jgi:peptidoglycan/LPS O-acetylase OafA/YrhL
LPKRWIVSVDVSLLAIPSVEQDDALRRRVDSAGEVRRQPLTPAGSALLDAIRLGAAVAVVVGHLSNSAFSTRWPYMLNLSVSAVAVFFVLSGFVIRLITTARPVTVQDYAVGRLSRIYSVTIPAVLFTCAVALLLHLFPFTRLGGPVEFDLRTIGRQVLGNLTFTGSIWGLDLPVSFNQVFWSLCYECVYYCFYGVALFARGWVRWVSLTALAALVGPPILFLLPLWLFGCVIHDVYQRLRLRRESLGYVAGVFTVAGLLMVVCKHFRRGIITGAAEKTGVAGLLEWTREHHLHLLQRASFHAYVIGIPAGMMMLWLLLLSDRAKLRKGYTGERIVRRVADGTFSVYLFHIPLLMLIAAFVPYDHASSTQKIAVLAFVLAVSILIEIPLNQLKRLLRSRLSLWMAPSASRRRVSERVGMAT